jgi:hypothetical protein
VGTDVSRIDPGDVRLKSEQVVLRTDDKIPDLLEASGIKPDVNALALIYDLNPDIDDIRFVTPGTPLVLPRVEGDLYYQMATNKGYRVTLLGDTSVLETVTTHESELKKVVERIANIDASRFSRREDKEALIKTIEKARLSLGLIGSNRYAVSRRVLKQSALEAASLTSSVSRALNSGGSLSHEFIAEAERDSQSLQVKSESLQTGGSAQARVEVQTIKDINGKAEPVPLLRIFYAPELDLKSVGKYRSPSTPTSEALPVGGRFTFWAANTEDGRDRVSDTSTVTVRSKSNDPIKLLVIK